MKTSLHNVRQARDDDAFEQCVPPSRVKPAKQPVSAKAKVLAWLARREHSQKELLQKLRRLGYSDEDAQEALVWATSKQFQSDTRFGQSLIRRRSANYGDKVIQAELSQHGVSQWPVQKAEALSTPDDLPDPNDLQSEQERAYAWLQRRYACSLEQVLAESDNKKQDLLNLKAKAMRALSARGFEFDNIHQAWKRLLLEFESDA
jgi:regulatory protein